MRRGGRGGEEDEGGEGRQEEGRKTGKKRG